MIAGRKNHPSIVLWVVFNEGWGEFDTEAAHPADQAARSHAAGDRRQRLDRRGRGRRDGYSRLSRPGAPTPDTVRATVLGEFGGLGLEIDGHTWEAKTWGYQDTGDAAELTSRYESLWQDAWDLHKTQNLSAAIYTQLTDVETESNGLMTYDRAVIKVDLAKAKAAALGRFPLRNPLAATSEHSAANLALHPRAAGRQLASSRFRRRRLDSGAGRIRHQGDARRRDRHACGRRGDIWLRRHFNCPAAVQDELGLADASRRRRRSLSQRHAHRRAKKIYRRLLHAAPRRRRPGRH